VASRRRRAPGRPPTTTATVGNAAGRVAPGAVASRRAGPTTRRTRSRTRRRWSRQLALSVAGFAILLGVGLVLGAQTSGPGHRLPFAGIIFGVQLLFVLAWTMAMRPPALLLVALVSGVAAVAADAAAVQTDVAGLAPLGYVAAGGCLLGVLGSSSGGSTACG
jgi:hypothetical protein